MQVVSVEIVLLCPSMCVLDHQRDVTFSCSSQKKNIYEYKAPIGIVTNAV